jgi:pyruvate formate lyase activating enzyme
MKRSRETQFAKDVSSTGMVTKIQRLAIHDGPGIRTLVFLKGCPLRCLWCSSPETQSNEPEILFSPERCIGCGECLKACVPKALGNSAGGRRTFDRSRCTLCGACLEVCYAEALQAIGRPMTISEVLAEVERDRTFYQYSDGGVTVSGGEPLQQPEFTRGLLAACKGVGLSTALETSGYQSWEFFDPVLPHLDLLLFDLKHMDPERHHRITGVSNELILANLKKVLDRGVETVIRYPVVPGLNDEEANVRALAHFLHRAGSVQRIDLLAYHRMGEATYRRLGRPYFLADIEPPTEDQLAAIAQILTREGFQVNLGG